MFSFKSRCKNAVQTERGLILQIQLFPDVFNNHLPPKRWTLSGLTSPKSQAPEELIWLSHTSLDAPGCLNVRGQKFSASWQKTPGWLWKATWCRIPRCAHSKMNNQNRRCDLYKCLIMRYLMYQFHNWQCWYPRSTRWDITSSVWITTLMDNLEQSLAMPAPRWSFISVHLLN